MNQLSIHATAALLFAQCLSAGCDASTEPARTSPFIAEPARAADPTFVSFGSSWRYLDDGSDQGTAWREREFDDRGWAEGPAELGYGDDDEVTVVYDGGDPENRFVTTYFRHTFDVADPGDYPWIELEVLRDDGAVVYLNGAELLRSNMPTGPIDFTSLAARSVGRDQSTYFSTLVPAAGRLVEGRNVVAVEVHQNSITSSDLTFDLRVRGIAAELLIAQGSRWKYLDDGSDQGAAWQAPDFDDASWAEGTAQFGYGDGDETTAINGGDDPDNRFITTYFRHRFAVADPASVAGLQLEIVRDDGAAIYLNGTLVHTTNMLEGPIDYQTLADDGVGRNYEDAFFSACLPAELLVEGDNVIAVEVHQTSPTSSDVSFDARLKAFRDGPSLERVPYLQRLTEQGVVLKWRTCGSSATRVMYGASPDALDLGQFDPSMTRDHSVELTGLAPGTRYYYAIGSDERVLAGGDDNHFFETAGTDERTLRIWAIGDSGTANSNAVGVKSAYRAVTGSTPTDVWLMLGDNAYEEGRDEQYHEAVFEVYPDLLRNTGLWATIGNHDARNAESATESGPYYDIFTLPRNGEAGGIASGTEAYYSFDRGPVHFISLDSHDTDRSADGAMMTWLVEDLADTSADWIIAFWHHPPYTKGSHDSDDATDSGGRMADMRELFLPVLEDAGVDLVLTGHSHSYERSFLLSGHYGLSTDLAADMILDDGDGRLDGDGAYSKRVDAASGAVYCVAGSSSKLSSGDLNHPAMSVGLERLGSMVIDVDGLVLDAAFLDNQRQVLDRFRLTKTCHGDVFEDGHVDLFDVVAVYVAWGACTGCRADLDGNGVVDLYDAFSVVISLGACF